MSEQKTFAAGFIVKKPHEKAPEFVKADISIKVEEFIRFLEEHAKPEGWVNLSLKEGRSGKWYCELNQFSSRPKAVAPPEEEISESDLPF